MCQHATRRETDGKHSIRLSVKFYAFVIVHERCRYLSEVAQRATHSLGRREGIMYTRFQAPLTRRETLSRLSKPMVSPANSPVAGIKAKARSRESQVGSQAPESSARVPEKSARSQRVREKIQVSTHGKARDSSAPPVISHARIHAKSSAMNGSTGGVSYFAVASSKKKASRSANVQLLQDKRLLRGKAPASYRV